MALREAHTVWQRELVAFRRLLALEVGSAHPDYQKLRVIRAGMVDEDDDVGVGSEELDLGIPDELDAEDGAAA